jgi:phosphoglycerol transferase MdoB-like AlkP superfamily enzyme
VTIACEILKLVAKGIVLGARFVFGLLSLAILCGCCAAATEAGLGLFVLLVVLFVAAFFCASWIGKILPYKRFLRTSSLSYLGLLLAVGMAGAGFWYGMTLGCGRIR